MAVTYTTAALVRKRVKDINVALVDADIEAFIIEAESIIDSIMKVTGRGAAADFTFNADKHGIIRHCCTAIAGYMCISYSLSDFVTLNDAEVVADLLWNEKEAALQILEDPRIVEYLKSL